MSPNAKSSNSTNLNMEQILIEGLKQALARGQSLQQAMESFYYAGYPKEEIEKAARAIHGVPINSIVEQGKSPPTPPVPKKNLAPIQRVSNYPPTPVARPQQIISPPVQPQKASEYKRQQTKPGIDWILISMLAGLFGLIGVLLFLLFK